MTGPTATPARTSSSADAAETQERLGELSDILVDAVAHGASVNFTAGFSNDAGQAFRRDQIPGIATGQKRLFVADDGEWLMATAILTFAHQQDGCMRSPCFDLTGGRALERLWSRQLKLSSPQWAAGR